MAILYELNEEQQKGHDEWFNSRPECIQKLYEKFPYNRLYRMKSSGHRVTIYSYLENNTMSVVVSGDYNLVSFERRVFGVPPEDLEECDLPEEGERLGVILNQEEALQLIDKMKEENNG